MPNVVTQPYTRPMRNPKKDNFLATMTKTVSLIDLVTDAGMSASVPMVDYLEAHPNGEANIWALAENRVGPRVWRAMDKDDLVLFYGHSEVYAYGFVASKTYWKGNDAIWPSGSDWDYVYSLRDVTEIPEDQRLPSMELREVLTNFSAQQAQVHEMGSFGEGAWDRLQAQFEPTGVVPVDPRLRPNVPAEARTTAETLLRRLIGVPLRTVTGMPNKVLGVSGRHAIVATERSPDGQPVEIDDVQLALDRLIVEGSVDIDPASIGHRSAFIGAVLMTLPGAAHNGSPPRISFEPAQTIDAIPADDRDDEGRDFSFQGDLDPSRQGVGRGEQRLLRRKLLGSALVGTCAICGKEFPSQFLWAAHIKKRSLCSEVERRDLANIAMLACVFGCDAMFETGLIAVSTSGELLASSTIATGTALSEVAERVRGRRCSVYSELNGAYFAWHRENVFRP